MSQSFNHFSQFNKLFLSLYMPSCYVDVDDSFGRHKNLPQPTAEKFGVQVLVEWQRCFLTNNTRGDGGSCCTYIYIRTRVRNTRSSCQPEFGHSREQMPTLPKSQLSVRLRFKLNRLFNLDTEPNGGIYSFAMLDSNFTLRSTLYSCPLQYC